MKLNKKPYVICFVLAITLASYLLMHSSLAEAQAGSTTRLPSAYVKWVQYPPDVNAIAINETYYTAVCGRGDHLYLAGYDFRNPNLSLIEVRRKSDGMLVASWQSNNTGFIGNCVIVGNKLYAIGEDLLIFDLPLSYRKKVTFDDTRWGIVSDGRYLYLAGQKVAEGNVQWVIEKRNLDGTLVKDLTLNPSLNDDYAVGIGINPVTGALWVVGYADHTSPKWWIELIDKDSMARIRYIDPKISGMAAKVAFDESGAAYVIGGDTYIVKFNQYGSEVKRYYIANKTGVWTHIAYLNRHIYAVIRGVMYIFDTDLNLRDTLALPRKIYFVSSHGAWGNAFIDGGSLFFTGAVRISPPNVWATAVYSVGVVSAVVVRGRDSRVWVSLDGGSSYTSLGGSTPDGPNAVLYGDKLFVAVRGSTNAIYYGYVKLFDGKFSGWILGPGSTLSKPALAAGPDGVYIAVRGGDNGIYLGKIREDGSFTGWSKLPGSTIDAPSIAYLNGRIHIVVRGGSNTIWHGTVEVLPNGTLVFDRWIRLPGTTGFTPDVALDPSGSGLYLAVTGGDGAVYLNYYSEAKGWHGWIRVGGHTDAGPAVAVIGSMPVIVVKWYNSTTMYYTTRNFNGTWTTWTKIAGSTDRQPEVATTG